MVQNNFYDNGGDIIIICASLFGFIIMLSRVIYKSKCKNISCCWSFCSIERNVEIEQHDIITNTNV